MLSHRNWRARRAPLAPKSAAESNFAAPFRGTRGQQIGDVSACDEQNKSYRAHQHQQRWADIFHHCVEQRLNDYAVAGVRLVLLAELRRDGDHVGARLLDGNAWLHPAIGVDSGVLVATLGPAKDVLPAVPMR